MPPKRKPSAAAESAAEISNVTRLVFTEGKSSKFWQITIEDSKTITQYGKIGSDGATAVKQHADAEKAKAFAVKEVTGKQKKGYVIDGEKAEVVVDAAEEVPAAVEEKVEEVIENPAKKQRRGGKSTAKEAEPAATVSSSSSTAEAPGPTSTATIRLTFSEGKSNKFWQITTEDSKTTVQYGKIGTDGVSTVKEHANADKAKTFADKEIAGKKKKGYVSSTD
eukprot:gene28991-38033_t